ncbi:Carbohydrate sulfotransferase 14 [Galdieria sulphuraria]|nr:Carbohydrate sulfotransferase 14 [Galdieria sulphuraria]
MNEHWAPQWYICGMDIIPYDFVGKLEHLEDDAQIVLSWIANNSIHLPTSEEIGFPSTQARLLEDVFFDINSMFLIRKAFAPDFKILGYN